MEPKGPTKPEGVVLPLSFAGDDVALVRALLENHPGAKDEFFRRYASQVERVITHVIGFDRELPDILQQAFLQALRSLPSLENPAALSPWLSRVAALTARKVLRTRSRRAWLRLFTDTEEEESWEPAGVTVDHEASQALRAVYAILNRLPVDERIFFALRFIEGMSVAEVAAACNVSLATAKRRLQRAERRFLLGARQRPELADWLKGSSRWQSP